jgi:cystathionine beta-lyase family protein involved in aluminum resistance
MNHLLEVKTVSDQNLTKIVEEIDHNILPSYMKLDSISLKNHNKVLAAFHKSKVSEYHLKGSTGYGYGDPGRKAVEKVFAEIFKAEHALVRGQITSGTHALALCLFGVLRPGDELISITGKPYDTLEEVIGVRGDASGNLMQLGIKFNQVNLSHDGLIDIIGMQQALSEKTKMVLIQRSRGYDWRSAIDISQIHEVCKLIKNINKDIVILVDNCYGEFVEEKEPIEAGADMAAGSLIKNPGGGIAPTGGYVVGQEKLVEMAANRLTAPGIGSEVGASLDFNRWFLHGVFFAPHIVIEALKGAVFTSALFEKIGFEVSPEFNEHRSDIIQGIKFNCEKKMIAFCRGLQKGSPLDGHVIPEPVIMPGYSDKVIMAGGTFISGSTIELSADGPLREPYAIYMQGGLSKEYIKLGILSAASECLNVK